MRLRLGSHLRVATFCALTFLGLAACASQQGQEEAELEATQGEVDGDVQQGDQQALNQQGTDSEGETAQGQEATGESNVAATQGGEEVVSNNVATENAATESDLQEIISEMNGDNAGAQVAQGQNAAAAPLAAEAAPTQVVDQSTPTAAGPVSSGAAAPVAAGGPGLPEMGSKMPYVVQKGDTLGKIAQKIYSDLNRWRDIANLTGLANPSKIYPGDLVYYTLEQSSLAFANAYDAVKRSQETVQPGDTLATIAKRVYGSSKEWKHIWRQNDHIDNPDKLNPGSTIYYVERSAMQAAMKPFSGVKTAKVNKTSTVKKIVSIQKTIKTVSVFNGFLSPTLAMG